jgi:DNA-binding transcriptional ArsR family regulator
MTDPAVARALTHPLRIRILGALEGRTASPSELSIELKSSLGVISYHVRRLTMLGFIKLVDSVPRRGAIEHFYTTVKRPRITDSAWASMPSIVKQATVTPRLDQIGAEAYEAVADGGFDAPETHLTRSPVVVDDVGWKELAGKVEALTGEIQRIEAESKKRLAKSNHHGEQNATVVLMLFHPSSGVPAPAG